jgi:pimeloyl-ACP methyl ester carboxylesterase
MSVKQRNNVTVIGRGPATMVFAHGFGCDQNMWRLLAPAYEDRYRIVLFDLVGSGRSDLSAFSRDKYSTLQGYADDVIEIVGEFATGPVLFCGHSVSSMIGMLANIKAPDKFAAQIMIGPSPCYINDGEYIGGSRAATSKAFSIPSTATISDGRATWRPRSWAHPTSPSSPKSSLTASVVPIQRSQNTSRASRSSRIIVRTCRSSPRRR